MRSAARAGIRAGNAHNPKIPFNFLFAPILKGPPGLLIRNKMFNGHIGINHTVCCQFNFRGFLLSDFPIEIHGHGLRTDMKTDIIISETGMDQTRKNMLTAVLLHDGKPPLPVNAAVYLHARRQLRIYQVLHLTIPFMHIQHIRHAESAQIRPLSSPLREKSRLIQQNNPFSFRLRPAFSYCSIKLAEILILII